MELVSTALGILLVIIGLVLLIVEVFTPGVFVIIPASVLIILGILGIIEPAFLLTWWAVLTAILVAVPVTILTLFAYRYLGSPEPPTTTITDTLVGKKGVVVVDTIPGTLKGKVRIDSDIWSANSVQPIPKGAGVKVKRSEGVHVFVEEDGQSDC